MRRTPLSSVKSSDVFINDSNNCLGFLFLGFLFFIIFGIFISCYDAIKEYRIEKKYENCFRVPRQESLYKELEYHIHIPNELFQLSTGFICSSESYNDLYYLAILVDKAHRKDYFAEWIFVIGFYNSTQIDYSNVRFRHPFAINGPANDYMDYGIPGKNFMYSYGNDGAQKALDLLLGQNHHFSDSLTY